MIPIKKYEEGNDDDKRRLKAREMVLNYYYKFPLQWPPRVFVWAWFRMPRNQGFRFGGSDLIDFFKKLANKKEYFALLEELKLKKSSYEKYL